MSEPVLRFDESLGQRTRTGTWQQLAVGTYELIRDKLGEGDSAIAAELISVTIEEAAELREIFSVWPEQIRAWIAGQGIAPDAIGRACQHVADVLVTEYGRRFEIAAEWDRYVALTQAAVTACVSGDLTAAGTHVEAAREVWRQAHDYCVDEVYGLLDVVARLCGEDALPDVWNHLMQDWYSDHASRLDLHNQPWAESARQLMTAIVHGFHGHLSGADRLGGMTFTDQEDRWEFQFDPCGSGGRVIRDDTTDGQPRPAEPFSFTVTTRPHDWSWGQVGVQAYCVHCCLLNMVMPIDRIGYPTRVIEPPTWPAARDGGRCTWWVYKDPERIPDQVYARVGRRRGPQAREAQQPGIPAAERPPVREVPG